MRNRVGRLLVAAVMAGGAIATTAAHADPRAPEVPETIAPPDGHKVHLVAHAVGVQIYRCDPANTWTLVAPRAELFDDNGKVIGTHFGGPTWLARDGSYVVARKVAEVNVDPKSIDWLLLEQRMRGAGPDGDRLAGTTFIQRVATAGGRAPAAQECDTVGETAEIPYTADYYFWKTTAS